MKRWLVLLLALSLAAIAGYALLTDSPPASIATSPGDVDPAVEEPYAAHGETDRETEQALREILRAAEKEE